jgi:hypothetical protein
MRKSLLLLLIIPLFLSVDDGTALSPPDSLRRPQKGEAARYPQDIIIGELGRGQASGGAYAYVQTVLAALLQGKTAAPILTTVDEALLQSSLATLKAISPQKVRAGGGRAEQDGSTSFLFRFIGREQWIVGEIYVRFEDAQTTEDGGSPGRWITDGLMLDDIKAAGTTGEVYRYDFSPYERFF